MTVFGSSLYRETYTDKIFCYVNSIKVYFCTESKCCADLVTGDLCKTHNLQVFTITPIPDDLEIFRVCPTPGDINKIRICIRDFQSNGYFYYINKQNERMFICTKCLYDVYLNTLYCEYHYKEVIDPHHVLTEITKKNYYLSSACGIIGVLAGLIIGG